MTGHLSIRSAVLVLRVSVAYAWGMSVLSCTAPALEEGADVAGGTSWENSSQAQGSGAGRGSGGSSLTGGSGGAGSASASGGLAHGASGADPGGGASTGGTSVASSGGDSSGSTGGGASSGGRASGDGGANSGGASSGGTGGLPTRVDPNFHVFLLLGQSNMDGVPAPQAEDLATNERVWVLGFDDCDNLGRSEGEWYTAAPPLHRCYGGVGPGDWFGKRLAEALPAARIGLVPCALPSADMDAFRKGIVSTRRSEYVLPPDNGFADAYEWVVHRARVAQQTGVIAGILVHQGESDTGDKDWVDKLAEVVADLRADLALGDAPLLAGELVHGACCDSHNPIIARVATELENGHVVSAAGLSGLPDQTYHFDLPGQRVMGTRYAETLLEVWSP